MHKKKVLLITLDIAIDDDEVVIKNLVYGFDADMFKKPTRCIEVPIEPSG